jgi:hypothetical protein
LWGRGRAKRLPGIQEDAAARVDGALQAALHKRISAVVFSFRDCARATEIRRAKYFRCTSRHTRCTMPSPNSRPLSYCATSSKNADRADGASGCAERKTCDI